MKVIALLLSAPVLGFVTLAQEKDRPFVLPDGQYSLECWGLNVTSSADGMMGRKQNYQKGFDKVSSANGVTTEILTFQNEDNSETSLIIRTTTITDLGHRLFKQTVETKNASKSTTFEVQLEAEGSFNRMLSATWDGRPLDVKGREFIWKVMDDGRIFAQDYFLPTKNKWVSNTTCIFTPAG